MEAHSPSFSCCVVPNFFQFIHLVSACLLPSEICLGPLLSFLTEPSSPLRNGFWLAGPRCTGFWEHYMPLWQGRIWCPNCFLNTKWQRSRKSPPACLFCFNILKWSTAHAEKTPCSPRLRERSTMWPFPSQLMCCWLQPWWRLHTLRFSILSLGTHPSLNNPVLSYTFMNGFVPHLVCACGWSLLTPLAM